MSIVFADLVGFTTLSEGRDPEDVRELLGRYFEIASGVVARYGGLVEKFIGDAVMALWGAPVAREDDAERAVRAALELCDAVAAFGTAAGAPGLRLRSGVLTGEAAITVGAQGQGMVAGDSVNTASRIQSVAPPGAVLVDVTTRRATEAAIAYEDAGTHELKGKAQPTSLWRAVRVVARVGGALRGSTLEAPFVGRDRELRLVKELFDATAEEARARLVAVSGDAGIGKTRLAWEFEKYLDGIAGTVLWHRGRCLPYGDGVAYRALGDMVRGRARITEEDDPDAAREKLRLAVSGVAGDDDEARWIEPRLRHLLDLDTVADADRGDLFAAWRLFFERLAASAPVVLLFEEMQWADAGLVDFVAYLLEWSRHHPLFVIVLARPEFADRHPTFSAGLRSLHQIPLEPLPDEAMDELLRGLAPGLPDDLRARVRLQAAGVPLYAVETVRMLIDRGLLQRRGGNLVATGAIQDLDVPVSLHGLIAARIDGLGERERAVVHDAAVLGHTFTRARLLALSGLDADDVDAALDTLVRREILALDVDPRSPERGQFAFAQALMQRVAYETLSRRDRRERHLAVARRLEEEEGEADDVVEVIASHYVDAIAAAPDHPDAPELRRRARGLLERAGDRVASLGATDAARRYYARAVDLVDGAGERGALLAKCGFAMLSGGQTEEGRRILEAALAGNEVPPDLAAVVTARLGEADWLEGRGDVAVHRLETAFAQLREQGQEIEAATVGTQLSRMTWLSGGDASRALEVADVNLEIAERHRMLHVLANDLNTKGMLLTQRGRVEEGMALLRHAVRLASEGGLLRDESRARNNLSILLIRAGEVREATEQSETALALAIRLGDRSSVRFMHSGLAVVFAMTGAWERALQMVEEIPDVGDDSGVLGRAMLANARAYVQLGRGDLAGARSTLEAANPGGDVDDPQFVASWEALMSRVALFEGDVAQARRRADHALTTGPYASEADGGIATLVAVEGAVHMNDLEAARRRIDAARSRVRELHDMYMGAFVDLAEAVLGAARGDDDGAQSAFVSAEDGLRRMDQRPELAGALIRHAEWLASRGRGDESAGIQAEVAQIAEALGAQPLLARVRRLREDAAAPAQGTIATPAM